MMLKMSIPKVYLAGTILLSLSLTGCSLISKAPQVPPLVSQSVQESSLPKQELNINGVKLIVEVANTDAERAQGLSGRESLPPDTGMLFLFDKTDRYNFWMNGMKFALDYIWLNQEQVVEITPRVPAPALSDPFPVSLRPTRDIDAVIEVPAGWAEANNVTVGSEVVGLTR